MRKELPPRLEAGRVREGRFASDPSWGAYGCFFVRAPSGRELKVIASGADDDDELSHGWEHVSVSSMGSCPTWDEMCFVKDLFWCSDETVVQFHPPQSEYVNQHPHCLHLWRQKGIVVPLPPSVLVGVKDPSNPTPEEARAVRAWTG